MKQNTRTTNNNMPKNNCCRRFVCTIVALGLIIIGGGIILWQFLPESQKNTLTSINTGEMPSYQFQKCTSANNDCCNGLDTICDLRADEIMYAGVHNSMSAAESGFVVAPNHDLGLEKSLIAGYRALNMDIGKCGGQLKFIHGHCKLGYRDPVEVFTNINAFLEDNPTEIIILNMEIDQGVDGGQNLDLFEINEVIQRVDGFKEKFYDHPERLDPWPTLRELRDTGKQVLMFHYNGGGLCQNGSVLCPTGFHDWFVYAKETEFSFSSVDQVRDTSRSCVATRGTTRATFLGVNMFVTLPSRGASTTMNSIDFLREHVEACADLNQQDVNVVFVDFWEKGDLPLYTQRQNDIRGKTFLIQQQQQQTAEELDNNNGTRLLRTFLRGWMME